jgi:alanyl-tRNA synthetase
MTELKAEKTEREKLNDKLAASAVDAIINAKRKVGKFTLITGQTEGLSVNAVRGVCDKIKTDADAVAVISVCIDGKYNLVACAGANAVKNGANAGSILKALSDIVGGGGGGRPDSATSGVRFGEKIPEALEHVSEILIKI